MPYDNERGGITTVKKYLDINVYEATQARLKYIFEHFENIYVSFSGGDTTYIWTRCGLLDRKSVV